MRTIIWTYWSQTVSTNILVEKLITIILNFNVSSQTYLKSNFFKKSLLKYKMGKMSQNLKKFYFIYIEHFRF